MEFVFAQMRFSQPLLPALITLLIICVAITAAFLLARSVASVVRHAKDEAERITEETEEILTKRDR